MLNPRYESNALTGLAIAALILAGMAVAHFVFGWAPTY